MAKRSKSATNTAAGAFLLLGLVGFLLISAIISGTFDKIGSTTAYTVRFGIDRGAAGVSPGSTVTLGGQPIGRVTGVDFVRDAQGAAEAIDVRVRINADQPLYSDASFVLVRPLLGGGSSLNIASVGTADAGTLAEGGTLDAGVAVPSFLADAGFGPTQVAQIQNLIARAYDAVDSTASIAEQLDADIQVITADATSFSRTLRDTAERVRDRIPELESDISGAAGAIAEAGEALERAAEYAENLFLATQRVVDDSTPVVEETLAAVQRVTSRIEAEHADAAMDLLEETTRAAKDLGDAAERAERLLAESEPGLRRSLANARLASDQLRAASIEIRRNPWRILARPDEKTFENEILYDAARMHADTASDLRDAAAALEAVLADAEPETNDGQARAEIQRLREELGDAMTRYRDAQEALGELLSDG